MSPQNNYRNLIHQVSLLTGLPKGVVELIVRYQFTFIRDVTPLKKSVRLKHLGLFGVKSYRKEFLDGKSKRNNEELVKLANQQGSERGEEKNGDMQEVPA